jgi:hypothetical protein
MYFCSNLSKRSYGNPFNGMTYNGAVRKWIEGVKHAEGKKAKMRVSEAA